MIPHVDHILSVGRNGGQKRAAYDIGQLLLFASRHVVRVDIEDARAVRTEDKSAAIRQPDGIAFVGCGVYNGSEVGIVGIGEAVGKCLEAVGFCLLEAVELCVNFLFFQRASAFFLFPGCGIHVDDGNVAVFARAEYAEEQVFAVGRPFGAEILCGVVVICEVSHIGAVGVHEADVRRAISHGHKGDLLAVGR